MSCLPIGLLRPSRGLDGGEGVSQLESLTGREDEVDVLGRRSHVDNRHLRVKNVLRDKGLDGMSDEDIGVLNERPEVLQVGR
jgi:hypothetical protein